MMITRNLLKDVTCRINIRRITAIIGTLVCGLFVAGNTFAANALKDIAVSTLSGSEVQITFVMQTAPAEPSSFTIGNPDRIALDFPDTVNQIAKKNLNIGMGVAETLSLAEAGGRTRAVVTLSEMATYQAQVSGNSVILTIGGQGQAQAAAPAATAKAAPAESASAYDSTTVTDIDFRRGENGEGRVIVTLSDSSAAIDVRDEAGLVTVDLMGVDIPATLQKRLDVLDFGTPVKTIDTSLRGSDVRMIITPNGYYEQLAYQSDEVLTIELRPLSKQEKEEIEKEQFAFTGDRLSLNFQNIEVRAVLQLIADFTGLNIVVSDTVSGSLTLRLQNVPWDQALDIILKTKGLSMRQNGNVVLIAPTEELAAREKLELESKKQIEELAPLRSEFVQINYAKATDIAGLLGTPGDAASILSSRGSVTIDERTNTLLVRDTAENLAEVRKLVAKLDIPVRQVLIESRIVIANNDFSRDLGVKFGYSHDTGGWTAGSSNRVTTVGGTVPGDVAYGQPAGYESAAGSGNQGLLVDLGASAPTSAIRFAMARLDNYLIELELSAMENEGKGEVVSNPRIITANQRKASIEQGVEIPYQEASSSGATSTSFKKAVLSLEVTPQITPDDAVIMDLNVKKDSVGTITSGGAISIDTREVETQVLVPNGETVVLGGIYEQQTTNGSGKVPYVSDIPLIGWLFQNQSKIDNRSELLIFVTPKVLKEDMRVSK